MHTEAISTRSMILSRRSLLLCFAASPLALLSCRTGGRIVTPPSSDLADEQLNRVGNEYELLARREPNLPGVRSLAQLNNQLVAGFSASDLSLLASALHLQGRERVAQARRPITQTDMRAILSNPIDMSGYGRSFLERTLTQARDRAAADPRYRHELDTVAAKPSPCGAGIPRWLCTVVVIIVIIIIIVGL